MENKFICVDNAGNNRFKIGEIYDLKSELGVANDIPIDDFNIEFTIDIGKYNKYPTFKRVYVQ